MAAAGGGGEAVQKALQSVAQSTGWTYSLLWRLCPRQGYASFLLLARPSLRPCCHQPRFFYRSDLIMHAWRCLRSALVWAEGHYNGAIRTRKTTVHQPGGEGADEETTAGAGAGRAALHRSRQLKELYDSLITKDSLCRSGSYVFIGMVFVQPALPKRGYKSPIYRDVSQTVSINRFVGATGNTSRLYKIDL